MKKYLFLGFIALVATIFMTEGFPSASGVFGFTYNPGKKFHLAVPNVNLSETEKTDLLAGKPICKLLPGKAGFKAGRMEVILPYDPVTVYQIITDIDHFQLTDPSYPSTGSITQKRKTFMPYVFDGAHCVSNGKEYLYQLLVLPFVDPRKYSLSRWHDTSEFPWESSWDAVPSLECSDKGNPEMAEIAKGAVKVTINTGSWRIGPLPPEMRKTDQDKMKSYVLYYVDTNPGGDLASLGPIVNKSTGVAMPRLVENIKFHGVNWRAHLVKYHTPADVAQYDSWLASYKKSFDAQ